MSSTRGRGSPSRCDVSGPTAVVEADELVTAGLPDHLLTIGAATRTGLALLGRRAAVHAGTQDARDLLATSIAQWRGSGNPGWERLTGTTTPDTEGWIVRLSIGE